MLNGKEYFVSFPDETPPPVGGCDNQNSTTGVTVELRAALEELQKYFEQFLSQAAEQ